jgi:hypothetical protein
LLADGSVWHLEREGDQMVASIRDKPEARYYYEYAYQKGSYLDHNNEPIGWKLMKRELRVIDSQTGEILGRKVTIIRVLPIYEALILGLLGPPIVVCDGTTKPPPPFPSSILKPVSTK